MRESTTEELWKYLEENVYDWENSEDFFENNNLFTVKNYKIFY